ncbi:Mannan polymerase II complex anp1 subunit [Myotisia sp. PD_48]|nr:Mannan polymerase II complex anp1 subunit [Myotisia sp. PD_48]
MATASAPTTSLLSILSRSYPHAVHSQATEVDLLTLTPQIFPVIDLTDAEQAEIERWVAAISTLIVALDQKDSAAVSDQLNALNTHLATRTTILGVKPSVVDVAVYATLAPIVEKWTPEERTGENGYHHIVRHVDFVQNSDAMALSIPAEEKVQIDVDNVIAPPKPVKAAVEDKEAKKKARKEKKPTGQGSKDKEVVVGRGKKDAAEAKPAESSDKAVPSGASAAVEGGRKKEKKEKQPKQPKKPAAPAAPLSPSLIDLRVGHILRAINHPNADSLYVSTIHCGDAPGAEHTHTDEETGLTVRTVCSGLNGLVPLAEMQGRKVVTVCNLKPVTMRGIKSAAMVLAASPRDESTDRTVELVTPPADAKAGERVYFEGWSDGEPEKVLNPKKKIWETFQPGFTTSSDLEVVFDSAAVPQLSAEGEGSSAAAKPIAIGKLVAQSGGVCKVQTLAGASVK